MKDKTTKEEKFDAIYQSYAEDIYRVCLFFTKDEEEAQNVAQQTFVNFYDCFEDMDPDCMFAYLVCTAKNLACNHQRD